MDEDDDRCWHCTQFEECYCDPKWDDCGKCGGSGEYVPDHCCVCGGSPYCNCCGKCGKPSVGNCECPIIVPLVDGKTITV